MLGGCTIFSGATLKGSGWSALWRIGGLLLIGLSWMSARAETELPLIQFSLKPKLCVLTGTEQVCHDQLEVKWFAEQPRSLCLYQTGQPQPLRCWQQATQGEYQFELRASASTDFQLRDTGSQQALSKQKFKVVYEDKNYRRQRRTPWSFY